ncbi:uncharacterized protein LOC132558488 [Ylistrum balloti]|uniref:uncharacterized protein LOC132558488 n=1 Tax=Ylistrum balloti TaxID=509963 RepID=UPI0029057DC6|nr:uncharacterized protein LOC132558488 [Ylistrum balloti]
MQSQSVKADGKGRGNFFETLLDVSNNKQSSSKQNFVLNLILPLLPVTESIKEAKDLMKEELSQLFYGRRLCCDMQRLVGSSTDGLALPEITHMVRSRSYKEVNDEDIIYLFPYLKVDPYHRRAFARPVSISSHPGYIQLVFNSDWLKQRKLYYDQFDMIYHSKSNFEEANEFVDSEGFVLRENLARKLRKEVKIEVHDKYKEESSIRIYDGRNVSVEYSHHGPAFTAEVCERTFNVHYSKDYVLAIPHPSWPAEAESWRHRKRAWPPISVINAAVKCGCDVVPKSHKNSKDPREFILSFGLASRTVAHALNIPQFRCYKLFKYLFRFHINKVKRGLSTYHCKQTMFWVCEKSDQTEWTEMNPFECLQRLLYQLESFLACHNLPNYFINDNNTIAHISGASVNAVRRDVTTLGDTGWSVILELMHTKRFYWLSRDISLTSLLSPRVYGDELTKQTMIETVLEYVSALLDKGEIFLALYLLGINMLDDMGMSTFVELTTKRLEQVIRPGLEKNTIVCLYGLLASLYHQQAMSIKDDAGESDAMIEKSRAIFDEILEYVDTHIWIYGEYYNLLSTTNQHQKLLDHFTVHLLPNKSSRQGLLYQGGIYSSINFHNRLTMDVCIQDAIVDCSVPSTAFLFFKIIETLMVLHTTQRGENIFYGTAVKALKHFDTWVKFKAARYPEICDEHVQVLLAYSYSCIGLSDGAEKYFGKAASFGIDYKDEGEPEDLISTAPVIIRLRRIADEQRSRHRKPYDRVSVGKQRKCSKPIPMKFGEVRINPFLHC